ncbi:tRNA1(Val) (adenine(37)-N6)-methyltransferase [Natroniella sulfidigena]|uniref:tRNA1(Val) (adenine(37)-N6)-methyltransferase n=1 Tax=Natroniella sulfidigena TaxID=723921 RepID=UPI00200AD1FE|nr:tRNA1(Val) (adenine(37)-N6)-methyltransferase [Natroniella sulfidigena]MCK8817088.1 tRNA1(Val) (adenine(37)-N6)-methyltransferase [Natroniella sulfidigena]
MTDLKLKEDERLDKLLIDDLELIQNPNYFCFSLDAVLLANFVNPKEADLVLDLGTGNGIIPHLIQAKFKTKQVYGIDIQAELIDMAKRSAEYNNLEDRVEFREVDLKEAVESFGRESFDYIVSNPPYLKKGSGRINPEDSVAMARHELKCDLEDVIRVSSQLVKYGGKVAYVYRTQRLAELLALLADYNLAAKRMRLVYSRKDSNANLFLLEASKGGGVGLEVLPPFIIYNNQGNYTEQIKEIYYPEGNG